MSNLLRPLPIETVNGLTPPLADFPYFEGADRFPFQSHARRLSQVNAWWLAEASFLAYGDAAFVEQTIEKSPLPKLNFQLQWIGTREENRGMVLSTEEAKIFVFRGTRLQQHKVFDAAEVVLIDQNDLWTDSKFFTTACDAGGKVHQGFLSGFMEVSELVDSLIAEKSESQSVWLTGHSLGGALAVLAATHLIDQTIAGVYTYGAPRVGNAEFADVLPVSLQQRFVHRDDWVPTVPPEFIGYRHGGSLQEVTGSGTTSFLNDMAVGAQSLGTAIKSMAQELRVDLGELPMKIRGIADHAPVYYATLLWNSLVEANGDSQRSEESA